MDNVNPYSYREFVMVATFHKAMNATRLLGILVMMIILMAVSNRIACRREKQLESGMPDAERLRAACWAIRDIYQQTGRLITSLPELEHTAYFPFVETNRCGYLGGNLSVNVTTEATDFRCTGANTDSHGKEWPRVSETFPREDPETVNRRMIHTYSSGIKWRTAQITGIRQIYESWYELSKTKFASSGYVFQPRPIPRPAIHGDLPHNRSEFRRYLSWQEALEGKTLKDKSDRPILLDINAFARDK